MEDSKKAPARRSLISLAYAQPEEKRWPHRKESLPGPWFDATVIGLFVVFGIAYFL